MCVFNNIEDSADGCYLVLEIIYKYHLLLILWMVVYGRFRWYLVIYLQLNTNAYKLQFLYVIINSII